VPTQVVAGDSPTAAEVPFWITACTRLQPPRRRNGAEVTASLANAVFPAVQALIADRLRTTDEESTQLNRDRIARRCGLGDAKKAGWLFDYLELIGFLRVQRHFAGVGRGRSTDTFKIFTRPPLNYVGPLTHAELERALDQSDQAVTGILFVGEPAGQTQGAGFGTFCGDQGAESRTLVEEPAGQTQGAGFGTFCGDQGAESRTLVEEPAGQTQGDQSGTFSQIDRSSISEREIEGSMEPVPGGTAKPPATGQEAAVRAAVRELVLQLPWAAWAQRHGQADFEFTEDDLHLVASAIAEAMSSTGMTLEQAGKIGQTALAEATSKPVAYLAGKNGAFRPPKLARRLRALRTVRLSDTPLPLPEFGDLAAAGARARGVGRAGGQPAAKAPPAGPGPSMGGPCEECGATADTPMGERLVPGPEGRDMFCPRCKPRPIA
jgi:hypothetical protein